MANNNRSRVRVLDRWLPVLGMVSSVAIFGCASIDSGAEADRMAASVVQASFRDEGIAKVDRLQ